MENAFQVMFTEKEEAVNSLFLTALVAGFWRKSFRKIVSDDSFHLTCCRVPLLPPSFDNFEKHLLFHSSQHKELQLSVICWDYIWFEIDLSRIPLKCAWTIASERGWGGHFHTFTVFLSTLTSTWCYCLLEFGKGLWSLWSFHKHCNTAGHQCGPDVLDLGKSITRGPPHVTLVNWARSVSAISRFFCKKLICSYERPG